MLISHNQYFLVVLGLYFLDIFFGSIWGDLAKLAAIIWCGDWVYEKIKKWSQ
jgi:hypothetical protein